ncbi:MAG: site-specific DNA-methyltransferase [Bifidobacteriaceae bacterium]|jgi:DNA modification methylase|nr:site-specific DNA-methyltransferase [Bifidobacteriaceae bacterium]
MNQQHARTNTILTGDARRLMAGLASGSVDMVFFSPPYFRLRDYGVGAQSGEVGTESDVTNWVEALVEVCQHARRLLTPTGSLWINLGDTWSDKLAEGAVRKSLLLGPERLALRLVKDGWLLRNKIVWAKANSLPSGVGDRLTSGWEYLYFLTLRPRYFFDLDAIREPYLSQPTPLPRRAIQPDGSRPPTRTDQRRPIDPKLASRGLAEARKLGLVGHPLGKNPGDVWRVASSKWKGAHRAAMPVELAKRAIAAACPERVCLACGAPYQRDHQATRRHLQRLGVVAAVGRPAVERPNTPPRPTCDCAPARRDGGQSMTRPGLVLDPFMGSGTTAIAAEALGRDWLGIELNPDYVELAQQRISRARPSHQPTQPEAMES